MSPTGHPMALEIRSDLRMGWRVDALYGNVQFKLLGDIVVDDNLSAPTVYFNNIHTLAGDTVHHWDKTQFKKDITLLGNLHMATADKSLAALKIKTVDLEANGGNAIMVNSNLILN